MSAWLCATNVFAQADVPAPDSDEWVLRAEENGVRVYTLAHEDSNFRAFKAETLLHAPIDTVMAVMSTAESCLEWAHACKVSESLPGGTFSDRYAYSVTGMPWPVTDRDYVLHLLTSGKRGGPVRMTMSAVPDRKPEVDGRLRVNHSETLYELVPRGEWTQLTWVQHTDPEGSLPSWLVNSLLVDIPLDSLGKLREVVLLPKYQGYELVYDAEGNLKDIRKSQNESDRD